MSNWRLTDELIKTLTAQAKAVFPLDYSNILVGLGAAVQAAVLVEWLGEECHIHHLEGRWEMDVDWPARHECDDCMVQLWKEIEDVRPTT